MSTTSGALSRPIRTGMITMYLLGFLAKVYRIGVITVLCGWFITPVFHISLSFWEVCGILLIIWVAREGNQSDAERDMQFDMLLTAIRIGIPEERMEENKEDARYAFCSQQLHDPEQRKRGANIQKGMVYGRIAAVTGLLGAGYGLHWLIQSGFANELFRNLSN